MRGIERQGDYYAHSDPELAQRAADREASVQLPTESEVLALLTRPGIPSGMLDQRE